MENLTDGRGISKGELAIIDGVVYSYYGFNETRKIHIFRDANGETTTLNSLKACFQARLKYYNQK